MNKLKKLNCRILQTSICCWGLTQTMARMTDDEADVLDSVAANYIRSQVEIKQQSPAQIIGELVRKELQPT